LSATNLFESLRNRLQSTGADIEKTKVHCFVRHIVGPTAHLSINHSTSQIEEVFASISEGLKMGNIVYNQTVRIINVYNSNKSTKHLLALQPHFPSTFQWTGKQYQSAKENIVIVDLEDYILLSDETDILFVSYLDGTPTLFNIDCELVAELYEVELHDSKLIFTIEGAHFAIGTVSQEG